MILIGGLEDSEVELPNSDMINYVLEHSPEILAIKLKSSAKSSDCLGVFVHTEWSDIAMPDEVREKTVFFDNTAHLVALLGNVSSSSQGEVAEEQLVEEPTQLDFTDKAVIDSLTSVEEPPADEEEVSPESVEEGIKEVPDAEFDILFTLPQLDENKESITLKVESLERVIATKDAILEERESQINDLYKLQEIQLMDMREAYENQITEANALIASLRKKTESVNLTPSQKLMAGYATHVDRELAVFNQAQSKGVIEDLKSLSAPLHVLCSGSGKSLTEYIKQVRDFIKTKKNVVILDFTGEVLLPVSLGLKSQEHSFMLRDDQIPVEKVLKQVGDILCSFSRPFNDIALLGVDWVTLLQRVTAVTGGKPIILLFGCISSFAVRTAVGQLAPATVSGSASCFVHSNALLITSILSQLTFLPKSSYQLVGLNYVPDFVEVYKVVGKTNKVITFSDLVDFTKLGIK